MEFLHKLYNPQQLQELIRWGGPLLLFCIVYAETGLFVGFFLPGDSLLVTAGLFSFLNPQTIHIGTLIMALSVAAIAGDNTGYWFGRLTGPKLFSRPDSRLFKRKHLLTAQQFYEKHGTKTVVLARFVPIVRTFGPIVAGVAEMQYRRFLTFSVIGGISWISSMSLLGYFLARTFPGVVNSIDKVIIVVVAVSLLPMFIHWLQERKRHAAAPTAVDAPASAGYNETA